MKGASANPFLSLRHRDFRMLWGATMVANLGALVQGVGAAWAMAEMTRSHDMVALVQGATALPIMIFALVAGAIADNFDRRRIMLASQLFMMAVSALLVVVSQQGILAPWSLLAFTLLLGFGSAMHIPAWQSSVQDLVPRPELATAVGLNAMSFNLMRSVAPALGGLLVAAAGATAAFTVNAACYLLLILALWRWQPATEERTLPAEGLGRAMAAGLHFVALSPDLMRVMARSFLFGLAASVLMALLPIVTRELLEAEAWMFGILLGIFGSGGILGGILGPSLRRDASPERIAAGSFLIFAAGVACIAASFHILVTFVGLLICGMAWVTVLSLFNVSAQLASPRWVVGRVLSLYQTSAFSGVALGSWIWGTVSEQFGPVTAMLAAAGALVIGALIGRVMPMPSLTRPDLSPADRFNLPDVALRLTPRSGPIQVNIHWRIAPEDTEIFLALMVERQRIRRRNGARQWVLLRDLEQPDRWTESYHFPTWTDHIRHSQRFTKADVRSSDKLRSLHRDNSPPVIHRMIEFRSIPHRDDLPLVEHP